jgi:hypothetical protein
MVCLMLRPRLMGRVGTAEEHRLLGSTISPFQPSNLLACSSLASLHPVTAAPLT